MFRVLASKSIQQASGRHLLRSRAITSLAKKPRTGRGFYRTLAYWTVGTGTTAGLLYYMAKDEVEALDSTGPPTELTLRGNNVEYKGHPIVETPHTDGRERLVVLGSGWGAISILKTLDKEAYDVTVVSPDNYFIFTPLLPSVTVGTVEFRSILEGIRRVVKRIGGSYVEAGAVDVDLERKLVLVEKDTRAWIPYDRLVVAVGAQSITHGAQGLEHCHKLKTITDARSIRQHIMTNFEKASLPTTPEEEKRRLLTFVVCGGGPTGCEFAAELYDFLSEDLKHYFPRSQQEMVRVVIIQSRDHILNMMDSVISEFAETEFRRRNIEVITNSRVQRISDRSVIYTTRDPEDGRTVEHEVPQGFVLWSTGLSLTPFTRLLCEKLSGFQKNRHAITVDCNLRVKGVEDGTVYALGDCSTVEYPHLLDRISELFDSAHHQGADEISREEFTQFVKQTAAKYPATAGHLQTLDNDFDKFDEDSNGRISIGEFRHMLEYVDSKLTALPALAQVANQEGIYLGHGLNKLAGTRVEGESAVDKRLREARMMGPFMYYHKGTLAYLGRAAAADFGEGRAYRGSNLAAKYLWRSVYWSQQVSLRTRLLLMMDWSKELLFGRDISKF